jgi:hypothetical protein
LCSHYIPSDTIRTDDCGLILDVPEDKSIDLPPTQCIHAWPNPCDDILTIYFESCVNPVKLEIVNIFGQLLYTRQLNCLEKQISIKTAGLSGGIIILNIQTTNHRIYSLKVIKI